MPDPVVLGGCNPMPLASYLKGLAVLRLIAEQVDPGARGAWQGESFVLQSSLDGDAVMDFLLHRYAPTPVVAPWNGGSGFNPKDNQDGIGPLSAAQSTRLRQYRDTIEIARAIRASLGITDKVADDAKRQLQHACRAKLPDVALEWFDAAIVMTSEGPAYPALLGTGGNDGRLDFSNNFMQRVVQVVDPSTGEPARESRGWLSGALFGGVCHGLQALSIGQFDPGGAGGANAAPGFSGSSLVNPWDFVLMLEGALLFAAASSKRLGAATSVLACPFSVHAAGVGYLSAAGGDEKKSRSELWTPLWERPMGLPELHALMAEGRAQVGSRRASSGVDFARAVATLGVDRGLTAFQRYAFQERNGQAYLALPLDRYAVSRQPQVDLLTDLDQGGWLEFVHRRVAADTAPASAQRAARNLDSAIVTLCRGRSATRLQDVLVALGALERSLARSLKWTKESGLRPCPPLREGWLAEAADGTSTWRLAVSLAGIRGRLPLRGQFEPVTLRGANASWDEIPSVDVVWHDGNPIDAMNAIVTRRLIHAQQDDPTPILGHSLFCADLSDIADFIDGTVDAGRVLDLVWGLMLVDGSRPWPTEHGGSGSRRVLPALYALVALCLQQHKVREVEVPLVPEIHRRAAFGDASRAAALAVRRLRASGLQVCLDDLYDADMDRVRRCAAAVLFPIDGRAQQRLAQRLQVEADNEVEREVLHS